MCWSTGREPIAQPPGDFRFTKTRQQRAQYEDGSTHSLDHLVGRFKPGNVTPAQFQYIAFFSDGESHLAKQLLHGGHVLQARHIGKPQGVSRQQSGTEYRQRRILGARNRDFAGEPLSACNQQLVHYA